MNSSFKLKNIKQKENLMQYLVRIISFTANMKFQLSSFEIKSEFFVVFSNY